MQIQRERVDENSVGIAHVYALGNDNYLVVHDVDLPEHDKQVWYEEMTKAQFVVWKHKTKLT